MPEALIAWLVSRSRNEAVVVISEFGMSVHRGSSGNKLFATFGRDKNFEYALLSMAGESVEVQMQQQSQVGYRKKYLGMDTVSLIFTTEEIPTLDGYRMVTIQHGRSYDQLLDKYDRIHS